MGPACSKVKKFSFSDPAIFHVSNEINHETVVIKPRPATSAIQIFTEQAVNLDSKKSVPKPNPASVSQCLLDDTGRIFAIKTCEVSSLFSAKSTAAASCPKIDSDLVLAELNKLKGFQHPNVVEYLKFSLKGHLMQIYMEFADCGSLSKLLKEFGPFSLKLASSYMIQALKGLQYLHDCGVIHGGIKGSNLLLCSRGVLKLSDYGLHTLVFTSSFSSSSFSDGCSSSLTLNAADSVESSTEKSNAIDEWTAPEGIMTDALVLGSDIWSAAATFLEMMSASSPPSLANDSLNSLHSFVLKHMQTTPSTLSSLLELLLAPCFQLDVQNRPTAASLLVSFEQLAYSLEEHFAAITVSIESKTASTSVDSSSTSPSSKWQKSSNININIFF